MAQALHKEIREVTSQPVVLMINENGQGHAMLGNGYWKEQGVAVLAHTDTIEIDQSRYAHLDTFDELASRNTGRLFEQMEFE